MTEEKPLEDKIIEESKESFIKYITTGSYKRSYTLPTPGTVSTDDATYKDATYKIVPESASAFTTKPDWVTISFVPETTYGKIPITPDSAMTNILTPPSATKTDIEDNQILWTMYNKFVSNPNFRVGYVWGPPGIGKTYGAQRLGLDAKKGSRKVYCVTLTEETPSAELRGHYVPKGGEFFWHDGPMARAMREGARIVINEVSHSSPDCLSFFYAALESPETSVITLPTGEDIRPNPGFQVILTDNVPPSHLPAPLQDRLDASFEVKGPSPEALSSFPEGLRNVVLATALSDASKRISLRSWETINRLAEGGMDIDDAGIIVLKNKWVNVKASVIASRITKK